MIHALDGSLDGMRYPRYVVSARLNDEPLARNEKYLRCGNTNSLEAGDYELLQPGESTHPLGDFYYLLGGLQVDKPGQYAVTLTYDTEAPNDTRFRGDLGKNDESLLKKVLRTKAVSNTVTFTIPANSPATVPTK